MNALAQYWNMWCINPGDARRRYQRKDVASAKGFFEQTLAVDSVECRALAADVQKRLLAHFWGHSQSLQAASNTLKNRANAGLCLRCYVSAPILKACQKIDSLFSGNQSFSYQDLLPFVLNDDGKTLVVVNDSQEQQIIGEAGKLKTSSFKVFSVEVLRTYKGDRTDSMSLDNWAFLRTKQQPDLKNFLAEFGFQPYSDWTLLNRIQVNQLERLSEREQAIVEAFHGVYRRDRRVKKQVSRCQDPTAAQLTEMNQLLAQKSMSFSATADLLKALKTIAKQLRTFDVWQAREPLEVKDKETGDYILRSDLPADTTDESAIEENDFVSFLQQQLTISLTSAIEQAVQNKIAKLRKSKKYGPFASVYTIAIKRYYTEGISLKDIGSQLGMNNWDQTRRILNPGELLSQARKLTAQLLLEPILKAAQDKGLAATPAEPAYLRTLMEQIEIFIDSKLFAEAASEIKAGKNRSLDSAYAKALINYIEQSELNN